MPCACSLPARTSALSEESLLPGARKNASLLCSRRGFVLAIVCVMFVFWPLLVYTEAQAGLESFLVEYYYDRAEEAQHWRKYPTASEQKGSTLSTPKFWNRKFLRQGSDNTDNSRKESNQKLTSLSPKGPLLDSGGGKFPGRRNSNFPHRRILIPATNVCTNKDISISQGPDGSSGIPRYFVQIVNTCMSDCAPSQVHVFCGWFASALLVNPKTFQRLAYNDCLVNGGKPLKYGEIVRFTLLSVVGGTLQVLGIITNVSLAIVNSALVRDLYGLDHNYECTNKDISITQRRDGSPGIPRFSVQIVNTCVSDCAPADIHVFCGWFASSPPPNPNTFQRLSYNDCLVNGGRPLGHGAIIQFQYANSFMYPIRFRSAKFCR